MHITCTTYEICMPQHIIHLQYLIFNSEGLKLVHKACPVGGGYPIPDAENSKGGALSVGAGKVHLHPLPPASCEGSHTHTHTHTESVLSPPPQGRLKNTMHSHALLTFQSSAAKL